MLFVVLRETGGLDVSVVGDRAGQFDDADVSIQCFRVPIWILGYLVNNKLNHQTYLNSLILKVNLRLYTIGLISKYISL